MARVIGTLSEKSLHAAVKAHYAREGDLLEFALAGYVIDLARPTADGYACIEVQTRAIGRMKPKLAALLDRYPVRIVHPIAAERWVVRVDRDGVIRSRRRSPKRGTIYDLFAEWVGLPTLIQHPNLSVDALLVREEQVWVDDGQGSWRRKRWSLHDRRLLGVIETVTLERAADFAALVPNALPTQFDTGELAAAIGQPRYLAQKMAYCLREMGALTVVGKRANALVYARTSSDV